MLRGGRCSVPVLARPPSDVPQEPAVRFDDIAIPAGFAWSVGQFTGCAAGDSGPAHVVRGED